LPLYKGKPEKLVGRGTASSESFVGPRQRQVRSFRPPGKSACRASAAPRTFDHSLLPRVASVRRNDRFELLFALGSATATGARLDEAVSLKIVRETLEVLGGSDPRRPAGAVGDDPIRSGPSRPAQALRAPFRADLVEGRGVSAPSAELGAEIRAGRASRHVRGLAEKGRAWTELEERSDRGKIKRRPFTGFHSRGREAALEGRRAATFGGGAS